VINDRYRPVPNSFTIHTSDLEFDGCYAVKVCELGEGLAGRRGLATSGHSPEAGLKRSRVRADRTADLRRRRVEHCRRIGGVLVKKSWTVFEMDQSGVRFRE
jgi:hypothetical protein